MSIRLTADATGIRDHFIFIFAKAKGLDKCKENDIDCGMLTFSCTEYL